GVAKDDLGKVDVHARREDQGEEEAHRAHRERDLSRHIGHRVSLVDLENAGVDLIHNAPVLVDVRVAERSDHLADRDCPLEVVLVLVVKASVPQGVDESFVIVPEDALCESSVSEVELRGEALHEPEVQDGNAVAGKGEDVAGMRVGVEVAVGEHLFHVDFAEELDDLLEIDARLADAIEVGNLDAVDALHEAAATGLLSNSAKTSPMRAPSWPSMCGRMVFHGRGGTWS